MCDFKNDFKRTRCGRTDVETANRPSNERKLKHWHASVQIRVINDSCWTCVSQLFHCHYNHKGSRRIPFYAMKGKKTKCLTCKRFRNLNVLKTVIKNIPPFSSFALDSNAAFGVCFYSKDQATKYLSIVRVNKKTKTVKL